MSDLNADFNTLLKLTRGVEVRSAEHPDDRRQRHRLEHSAVWFIGAFAALSAAMLMLTLFRPVPDKRADWAAGGLQLVLGGAVGFALKRPS
jgi:hypothetical protein